MTLLIVVASGMDRPVPWRGDLNAAPSLRMLRPQMLQSVSRAIGLAALVFGLVLPLGTVLCVHDGGHASLEVAGLGGCADTHDSLAHDTSSHRDDEHPGSASPCVDTSVDTSELKTSPATDYARLALVVASAATPQPLPPSAFDPNALTYRVSAETARWVTAFDATLRTTVVLC